MNVLEWWKWLNINSAAVQAIAAGVSGAVTIVLVWLTYRAVSLSGEQVRIMAASQRDEKVSRRRELGTRAHNLAKRLDLVPHNPYRAELAALELWTIEDEARLEEVAMAVGVKEGELAGRIRCDLTKLRMTVAAVTEERRSNPGWGHEIPEFDVNWSTPLRNCKMELTVMAEEAEIAAGKLERA